MRCLTIQIKVCCSLKFCKQQFPIELCTWLYTCTSILPSHVQLLRQAAQLNLLEFLKYSKGVITVSYA